MISNSPIKRNKLTEWVQKWDPFFCSIQETHLHIKDRYCLRIKNWEKIVQANRSKKQAHVVTLISNKIDI